MGTAIADDDRAMRGFAAGPRKQDYGEVIDAGGMPLLKVMNLNEEDFRWAAATLLSRSFSLDIGEDLVEDESLEDADIMSEMWAAGDTMSVSGGESGLTVALVPWADMLNHSSDAGRQSVLAFNAETRTATLAAHRQYQAGEEVFDSYGTTLAPWELLLDYGFVDAANSNHQAQLDWRALASAREDANDELLKCVEMAFGGLSIVLTEAGIDSTGLACLRAASASKHQLAELGWKGSADPCGAMTVMANLIVPIDRDHELMMLETTCAAIKSIMAAQREPLVESPAEEECAADLKWVTEQVKLARDSERFAMQEAYEQLQDAADRIRQGCPPDQAYLA